jgi:hypothetical protein
MDFRILASLDVAYPAVVTDVQNRTLEIEFGHETSQHTPPIPLYLIDSMEREAIETFGSLLAPHHIHHDSTRLIVLAAGISVVPDWMDNGHSDFTCRR